VLKCTASASEDPTVDPRFGKMGMQRCQDTGALTKKRMETIDDETTDAAVDFMQRQVKAGKPFFVWMNTTRMHLYTHVRPSMLGRSGISEYFDGMLEHDDDVGKLLKALDDLGIADDTILVYSTDNGPHMNSWPDGGMTPFRNEKNSNWEGAFRVPAMVRWPGHVKPGSVSNELFSGLDWFPTLLAAAGDADVTQRLLKGWQVGGRTYKNHLDGFDQLAYLTGQAPQSARKSFFYFNDDGQLVAMRYQNWKQVFCEQRAEGTLRVWSEPFTCLRVPKLYNLRMDPYERADITSNTYYDWLIRRSFLGVPTQAAVAQFIGTFKEFPPRQKPASFSVDDIMLQLSKPAGG
jgi:arylsulfatase